MNKYDKIQVHRDLNQIESETILGSYSSDPVNKATTFQGIFESILDGHAPVQKKRIRNQFTPWLTASLTSRIMKRDILKKEIEKSLEKWPAYRKLRNKVTKEIRDAIRDYYRRLIDENIGNPKKMWTAINKVLGKKENSVKLSSVEIEGKYLTRERDILEALNQHFVTVGPNLAKKITAKPGDDCLQKMTSEQKEMKFKTVSSMHTVSKIKKLRIGKAAGPDNIPKTVARDVGDLVAKPLAIIYNSSLENGIFPDIWKLVRVTPIFKSGVKKDVNNYRPISVISVFSRILERIVHDQTLNFILENNVHQESVSFSKTTIYDNIPYRHYRLLV